MTLFRGQQPVELRFGTSGLRGLVTDITDIEAYINTRGFLESLGRLDSDVISVAGDLRPSSDRILLAVARAVEASGYTVDYLGKIPTPALTYHALENGRASVMVTGSHIPFDRNGIKFNKPTGEVLKEDEASILESVGRVREEEYARESSSSIFDDEGMLREPGTLPPVNDEGADRYLERYTGFFRAGGLEGRRVVVFQHSAVGRDLVVEILSRLGASVVPMGRSESFIPIDTEDITAERLSDLQKMADEAGEVDAIVSTDGDSDRPLVAGVDGSGTVRFFGGDLLGIVVAKFLGADAVSVPISCNDAVDLALGDAVTKTRIGSPYVVKAMLESVGEKVVGWEANGGFLTASDIERDTRTLGPLPTRDAVLPILCALYASSEAGQPLEALFDALPPRYSKAGLIDDFAREKSLAIVERFASGDLDELQAVFRPELGFGAVERVDTLDGLRIFFQNGDIAHIRASGNAPQLRIYAVADTQSRADEIVRLALDEPDGLLRRLEKTA